MNKFLTFALAAVLYLAQALPSEAWLVQGSAAPPPSYTGVADTFSGVTFGASCTWSISAAYATGSNNACLLERPDNSSTCTVKIATSGQADYTVGTPCTGSTQSVATWATRDTFTGTASSTTMTTTGDPCAAAVGDQITWTGIAGSTVVTISTVTSCSAGVGSYVLSASETFSAVTVTDYFPVEVTTAYDQTGGNACASASCNFVQPNATDKPLITWNCIGTLVCLRTINNSQDLPSANNFTPNASLQETFSAVVNQVSGTNSDYFISANANANNAIGHSLAASTWRLIVAGTACCATAASDGNWHAGNGVMQAGTNASIMNVDGTETTGTETPNATAGKPVVIQGGPSVTLYWVEAWVWDNQIATLTQRNALCTNESTRNGLSLAC